MPNSHQNSEARQLVQETTADEVKELTPEHVKQALKDQDSSDTKANQGSELVKPLEGVFHIQGKVTRKESREDAKDLKMHVVVKSVKETDLSNLEFECFFAKDEKTFFDGIRIDQEISLRGKREVYKGGTNTLRFIGCLPQ